MKIHDFEPRSNSAMFAQALYVENSSGLRMALGSDSILPLDARFNVWNVVPEVKNHFKRLNTNLGKGYTHAAIVKWGRVAQIMPLDELTMNPS